MNDDTIATAAAPPKILKLPQHVKQDNPVDEILRKSKKVTFTENKTTSRKRRKVCWLTLFVLIVFIFVYLHVFDIAV